MSSSNSSSSSSSLLLLSVPAANVGIIISTLAFGSIALIIRSIKRYRSQIIRCKLRCRCGQIEGELQAKKEDSISLSCYCRDCRDYAYYIASIRGKNKNDDEAVVGKEYGETQLVQVCKNAIIFYKGEHLLKLAQKAPPSSASTNDNNKKKQKQQQKQLYMHRYYSSCCKVPIMNTFKIFGFVGVFYDVLDNEKDRFDGPYSVFSHESLKPFPSSEHRPPDLHPFRFWWNLLRYQWWSSSGPFNYELDPIYWGTNTKKKEL